MWLPAFLKRRPKDDDGARTKKPKKKDKGNGKPEECSGEGGCDPFPDEYENGGVIAKGERAQQLHRHDHESRATLCDIDRQIERLQKIREHAIKLKKSKGGQDGRKDKKKTGSG